MTIDDHQLPAQAAARQQGEARRASRGSPLGRRIAGWLRTAASYYSAATVYEQLSALSDAELRRRGLSRSTLARDVCAACERAEP